MSELLYYLLSVMMMKMEALGDRLDQPPTNAVFADVSMMSAAVHKLYFDSAADEDSSYFGEEGINNNNNDRRV